MLPRFARPAFYCLGLLFLALVAGCTRPQAVAPGDDLPEPVKPTGQSVKMVIDFDDGLEKHYLLAWHDGMTALDALAAAANRRRGVVYEQRGSGDRTLITAIDGVANESGVGGKGWLYHVNDESAKVSAGAYALRPGDVILWKFANYQ